MSPFSEEASVLDHTSRRRILDLLGQVYPEVSSQSIRIETIVGGITNRSFVATVGDKRLMVRLSTDKAAELGIDRRREKVVNQLATELGVAPEVLLFEVTTGDFVADLIDVKPDSWASRPDQIREVARLLRLLHSGPTPDEAQYRFAPRADVERWSSLVETSGGEAISATTIADIAKMLEGFAADGVPLTLIHNDLDPGNVLFAEDRAWLIDWEYSGVGDPRFDLASYARHLSEVERELLLTSYHGSCSDDAMLELETAVNCILGWTAAWALAQDCLGQGHKFDYFAYAAGLVEGLPGVRDLPLPI